jgi:lipid II:glycine glycyltransferase (peptidoglycan interpeptide bridge formation enzyme)
MTHSTLSSSAYRLRIGAGGRDDAWDAFVDSVPGGHHVQTSRWAEVKQVVGWQGMRIVAERDGVIAGGCQLLVRRLPVLGAVGYAAKAPLMRDDDPKLVAAVLDGLDRLARDRRILYVKLQPPSDRAEAALVAGRGDLVASDLAPAPTCTVRIDTGRPLEDVFRSFHRGTRSNIRKSERRGVRIRAAGERDLPTFAGLVAATARRQGFPPYPPAYYEAMWRAFAPDGHARLLLAELDGEPLAGVIVIGCADSAIYKMGAWGGHRSGVHPNELVHWAAVRWARERGYRYYDFEGIDERVARALVSGDEPPAAARHGVTRFKLSFGGEVVLFPGAYDWASRPWLRRTLPHVAPRLRRGAGAAQRLLGRRRARAR